MRAGSAVSFSTVRVGVRKVPWSAMRAARPGVSPLPCSMLCTPASTALAMPWVPIAWAATFLPRVGRRLHHRGQLSQREPHVVWPICWRGDTAGRRDLDHLGAVEHQLPGVLGDLVGAIGHRRRQIQQMEQVAQVNTGRVREVAVAAGRAEHRDGVQQPRRGGGPGAGHLGQIRAEETQVPDGGDTRVHRGGHAGGDLQHAHRRRLQQQLADVQAAAGHREMHVGVDEARQQRSRQRHPLAFVWQVRGLGHRPGPGDHPGGVDQDTRVGHRGSPAPVHQLARRYQQRLVIHVNQSFLVETALDSQARRNGETPVPNRAGIVPVMGSVLPVTGRPGRTSPGLLGWGPMRLLGGQRSGGRGQARWPPWPWPGARRDGPVLARLR